MRDRLALFLAIAAISASPVAAAAKPVLHAADLARALARQGQIGVRTSDIRVRNCQGFAEEPSEFRCYWLQRSGTTWRGLTATFAVDGKGWHVID